VAKMDLKWSESKKSDPLRELAVLPDPLAGFWGGIRVAAREGGRREGVDQCSSPTILNFCICHCVLDYFC